MTIHNGVSDVESNESDESDECGLIALANRHRHTQTHRHYWKNNTTFAMTSLRGWSIMVLAVASSPTGLFTSKITWTDIITSGKFRTRDMTCDLAAEFREYASD